MTLPTQTMNASVAAKRSALSPRKRINSLWGIVAVLAIALALALIIPRMGQKDIGSVSPREKDLLERSVTGNISPAEKQELQQDIIAAAEAQRSFSGIDTSQGQSQVSTPTAGEWPVNGTWKMTNPPCTIIYREADSAKGKIQFSPGIFQSSLDKDVTGRSYENANPTVKNLTAEKLQVRWILRGTLANGEVMNGTGDWSSLRAGGEADDGTFFGRRMVQEGPLFTKLEFAIEVKP